MLKHDLYQGYSSVYREKSSPPYCCQFHLYILRHYLKRCTFSLPFFLILLIFYETQIIIKKKKLVIQYLSHKTFFFFFWSLYSLLLDYCRSTLSFWWRASRHVNRRNINIFLFLWFSSLNSFAKVR